MRRIPSRIAALGLVLVALTTSCTDGQEVTIQCRLTAGSDANEDIALMPLASGDLELSVEGAAGVVTTSVGDIRGSISVTVTDPANPGPWFATAVANFDADGEREEPGTILVDLSGLLPSGTPFAAYCWVP